MLSHDAGQKAADYLAEQYGIEQWCQGLPLPIGFTNTRNWLMELGQRLGAEQEAQKIIAQGETLVVETCRRRWLEQTGFHRAPVGVVADATVGIPLLRFITEDLEMIPRLVCLRSGQTGTREMLERELAELGLEAKVVLQRRCVPVENGAGRGQAGDRPGQQHRAARHRGDWTSLSCSNS